MAKSGKRDWGRIRQALKDALPADPTFNRVDSLNLLMFLAHNADTPLSFQDLEVRLADLGPKLESLISTLEEMGLVKTSKQRGIHLSKHAIDLMSAPPKESDPQNQKPV